MKKSFSTPVCLFSCHIFVWSRTKLSVAKFVYFFMLFCIELCASVQQTSAFQMENNWNSLVRLFIGWFTAAAVVFFSLRLYPYLFAFVYFDSESMLYIVHSSRYTHMAWELSVLHRAYFTVEEFVYLTFDICDSEFNWNQIPKQAFCSHINN